MTNLMKGILPKFLQIVFFLFVFISQEMNAKEFDEEELINKAKAAILLAPNNPDSCKQIALEILSAPNAKSEAVQAFTNTALAEFYFYTQDFDSSMVAYKRSLEGYIAIDDKENQATMYNNMGLIYYYQGFYGKALKNYTASLELEKAIGNDEGIAYGHHNIGMIYGRWERYDQLFEHYDIALSLYEKLDRKESIAALGNNMGVVYANLEQYDKAMESYRKSYFAYKELGDKKNMASISTNLGCLFIYLKQNHRAIEYLNEAISYFEESNDKMNLIATYSSTGDAYKAIGDLKGAMKYYLLAEKENEKLDLLERKKDNYYALYDVYKTVGEFEKALQMYEMHSALKDSIFSAEKYERLIELEKKYHSEKSERELLLLKAKEEKQELYLWGLSIFFVFSAVLALIWFSVLKFKEKQKRQIMEQKILRTQMNPHFIFNALSALQCVILEENQEEAVDFVLDFSSLMRLVLQYSKEENITLKKEKEILERYMSLQNRRFDKKIGFEFEFEEQLKIDRVLVPPMMAQPFVENAIEHGCLSNLSDGYVKVRYGKEKDYLTIAIEDNGIGIKQSKAKSKLLKHKSLAMDLTKERIKLLHENRGKSNSELEIQDLSDYDLKGTRIAFRIPYMELN